MSAKTRSIISLIFNIVLVVLAIPGAFMSASGRGFLASSVYYTQDSNLFLGVMALIYVIAMIRAINNGTYEIPFWVQALKYLSVCCIAVTFIVVIFILAPAMQEYGGLKWLLFYDSMLYQHFLSPVIAIIGFVLFEKTPKLSFRMVFIALIPTLIYAAVLYPLNIARIVEGPYPFLMVHRMPAGMAVLWFFIMCVLSWLLAWLVWLLNRKIKI